jgi:general stress protein 26
MASETEIREKFWKHLKSERTIMVGLINDPTGHSQPMTAQLEDDREHGPIWIFSSKETDFVKSIGVATPRVMAQFVSKGHDLFACFDGDISLNNDRAMIDKLWSPYAAAWFEGGKDDPKLQLLRLDPGHAHIWLNENSLFAGVKLLLGSDPKKDYAGKTADVTLGNGARPS